MRVFAVPLPLVPMAAVQLRPPFHRDGWIYEEKVDGWRMLAYKDGPRVSLVSRNAVDHTARFRELAGAIAKRLESDGACAWQTVERRGLEGFVAKDPESAYRGGPTRSWVKVKVRREGVFVVGGCRNVDAFDGVLVGEVVDGRAALPRRRGVGLQRR